MRYRSAVGSFENPVKRSPRGDPGDTLQIGEVAEIVGLSLRTIRYYGEIGLAPPSARTQGGFRLYTQDDVARLLLIMHMKPLNFSLEEMRQLFDARERVRSEAAPQAEDRDALLQCIGTFADLAEERCTQLREQLSIAESLAAQLRREHADRG